MFDVQLSRSPYDRPCRLHVASTNAVGHQTDATELVRIFQQRDFDCFTESTDKVAVGKRFEQCRIVDHAPWDGERADPVLLLKQVHTVLHADSRIGLGQRRRGKTDQSNPPVCDRCGKPDCVENGTTSDDHYVTASIQVGCVNALQDVLDDMYVVLDLFATRSHLNVPGHFNLVTMRSDKAADLRLQIGVRFLNSRIDPELHPSRAVGRAFHEFQQHVTVSAQHVCGKTQAMHAGDIERNVERTERAGERHRQVGLRCRRAGCVYCVSHASTGKSGRPVSPF